VRPLYHPHVCQRARKLRNEHLACSFRSYCAHWRTCFPRAYMGTGYPSELVPAHPTTQARACPTTRTCATHTEATKRAPSVLVSWLSCTHGYCYDLPGLTFSFLSLPDDVAPLAHTPSSLDPYTAMSYLIPVLYLSTSHIMIHLLDPYHTFHLLDC
jgi:hypothetical protein